MIEPELPDLCVTPDCTAPVYIKKRRMCLPCYDKARQAGTWEADSRVRHTVLSVDAEGATGECSRCGAGARVVVRQGKPVCWRNERSWSRKSRHGIDYGTELALIAKQDGRCAICAIEFGPREPHCIDHDHACCPGKASCGRCVRGLLCRRCNVGIGMFGDDPVKVELAGNYLRKLRD